MQQEGNAAQQGLEAQLFERAAKDAAFRQALMEDPNATIERELGVTLPAGVSLTMVEETATSRYLVLPPAPRGVGGELSDAELEAVVGGEGEYTLLGTCECVSTQFGCPSTLGG
jgi:hypothetical protein